MRGAQEAGEESLTEEGGSRSLRPGCGAFANGYFSYQSLAPPMKPRPQALEHRRRSGQLWFPSKHSLSAGGVTWVLASDWVCSGFSGAPKGAQRT